MRRGGAGDDRIAATDGDDWLYGNGGDDLISARPGNDFVYAGDGERVRGGQGDDLLDGEDGVAAPLCGAARASSTTHREGRAPRPGVQPRTGRAVPDGSAPAPRDALGGEARRALSGRRGVWGFLNCSGTMKLHEATGPRRLLARRRGVANVSYRAEEASSNYDNFTGHADWAIRVRSRR